MVNSSLEKESRFDQIIKSFTKAGFNCVNFKCSKDITNENVKATFDTSMFDSYTSDKGDLSVSIDGKEGNGKQRWGVWLHSLNETMGDRVIFHRPDHITFQPPHMTFLEWDKMIPLLNEGFSKKTFSCHIIPENPDKKGGIQVMCYSDLVK